MAVSLKQYFAPHKPDLTPEQLDVATKVSNALRKEEIDEILELLKDYEEQDKDSVLSLCARYLVFNNIPTTYRVNSFLIDCMLRLRFYTSLKNDTAISIPASNILIEYIKNEMKKIVDWTKKTNLILLYHIKQIILNANGIMYDGRFKQLPWKQFVFYLQQYVRYFEVYDENHVFLLTLICLENLKLFVRLFLTSLESITEMKKHSVKTIIKNNIEAFNKLKDIYEHIRNMYTLNRMEKYFIMWKEQHFKDKNIFSYLRVLQVIGESLKNTPATPNLSEKLKERIVKAIRPYNASVLIKIRNNLSHFTSLPFVLSNDNRSIYKILDYLINNIENIVRNEKSEISRKLSKNIYKNDDKVELPKGISARKAQVYFVNVPQKNETNGYNIFIDFKLAESHSTVCNALEYLLQNDNILGMELILMIKLNHLKEEEKRLNDNRRWMNDKYPTLSGNQLRNHLAHGDPIVELLQIDEVMAIRNVAKLLLEDIDNRKNNFIQKVTQIHAIEMQKNINENELTSLHQKQKILDLILEGDLDEVQSQLQNVQPDWIHWCNERGENALQLVSRNNRDNLQLFEFVLDNNLDFLETEQETNILLAPALLKKNKKIAKFLLDRHIEKLLNMAQNHSEVNYTDQLDNFIKINHKQLEEILTDRICFILCCFGISIDNDEFLKLLSKTVYWISFENIFQNYGLLFVEILCLFDTFTIDRNRYKSGRNALHIAIENKDVRMFETEYNKYPYFVVLRNEKQQTPLDVAINMKNEKFLTTIIKLVIEHQTETEIFKQVFYNSFCSQFCDDLIYSIKRLLDDFSLGNKLNKLVQYWQLKIINSITFDVKYFKKIDFETNLLEQLPNILEIYNYDKYIINECAELLYRYICAVYLYESEYHIFWKHLLKTFQFSSIPSGSQVLIMLYKKIDYNYEFIGNHFWEVLIEIPSKTSEILLFKIKLIYHFDMHTNKSNSKNILEALKIVAKQPSFNDLDDRTYYIWVDVFITTTAILNYKPIRETKLDNNQDTIEVQLENLLNNSKVDEEIKKQLMKLFSQNSKHILISGTKNEIIEFFKNKEYMWQRTRENCLLKYISLNKNIIWEDMKCILDIRNFDDCELNSQRKFNELEESCLMVRNEAILGKLLEVSACYNLISKKYVTDEKIQYPLLKDYNIYNITELVKKLRTRSIPNDLEKTESIIFYIIHSDNVNAFSSIINLEINVDNEFMVRILQFACQCGAIKIIKYLINTGVDLNAVMDNKSTLYYAVKYEREEIIQLLLKQGATTEYYYLLNKRELMPTEKHHKLHEIIKTGNVQELKTFFYMEQGMEWRSSMETGNTCLHFAFQNGNVKMVDEVFSKCAHLIITKNYYGISPFDMINEELSPIIGFKTLINLAINNYPNGVNILHNCLQKYWIFNLSAEIAIWLFPLLINLIFNFNEIILNRSLCIDIMNIITYIIRHHYKHDTIVNILMSRIITIIKNYVVSILMKQVIINEDTTLFNLLALFVLRADQYPNNEARMLDTSKYVLEKFGYPNQVKYILLGISCEVMNCESTHNLFTNYAVDAIKKFPNKQEIQENALELIYYAYKNGEKPQLSLDNIRNLLQSFKWWSKKEIEMKATIFAYYFIWHKNIERENIHETIYKELNNWRLTNFGRLKLENYSHTEGCWYANYLKETELAKQLFRDEIINLV